MYKFIGLVLKRCELLYLFPFTRGNTKNDVILLVQKYGILKYLFKILLTMGDLDEITDDGLILLWEFGSVSSFFKTYLLKKTKKHYK